MTEISLFGGSSLTKIEYFHELQNLYYSITDKNKKHLSKKLAEETRNKMKKRTGAKNGFYGKIHSKESKIKMSNTKKVKYGNVL